MISVPETPSAMMAIHSTILNFCSLLASVLQLEVEVVDHRLIRVAGTGPYGDRFGYIPASNTRLLRNVIENRKEIFIIDSRANPLCNECEQRGTCQEKAFLGVPVMGVQRCLGAISLIAVNEEQHQRLSANVEMFTQYIRHVSHLLVTQLGNTQHKNPDTEALWQSLLASMDQGVILLDRLGRVKQVNDRALAQLHLPRDRVESEKMDVKPLSRQPANSEGHIQHIVTLDDRQFLLTGQLYRADRQTLFLLAFHQSATTTVSVREEDPFCIDRLIGQSAAMKKLKKLVIRIASSPSSVFILGESGTGKEVVARAIHRLSNRHDKPFVAINCAAIPENLLESELFGYVKGAFTGAAPGGRQGLIQSANGGTLFLDEIGDMPLSLQARLLRAIESREVMPVGANRAIPVDIRIISATHQDLESYIKEGKFREDLYYRLNVIPLFLPPLREREGDIELLLHYFLNLHSGRIACTYPGVSQEVLRLLKHYRWPGNVRELSNLVEYLVNIVPDGEIIDSALLPPVFHKQAMHISPSSPVTQVIKQEIVGEDESAANLKSVEKTMIEEALQRSRNKKQIADELGIGVATLYRKIKKYGLA